MVAVAATVPSLLSKQAAAYMSCRGFELKALYLTALFSCACGLVKAAENLRLHGNYKLPEFLEIIISMDVQRVTSGFCVSDKILHQRFFKKQC